jgi:hypothetical protein
MKDKTGIPPELNALTLKTAWQLEYHSVKIE